jgi:hypothetical protein
MKKISYALIFVPFLLAACNETTRDAAVRFFEEQKNKAEDNAPRANFTLGKILLDGKVGVRTRLGYVIYEKWPVDQKASFQYFKNVREICRGKWNDIEDCSKYHLYAVSSHYLAMALKYGVGVDKNESESFGILSEAHKSLVLFDSSPKNRTKENQYMYESLLEYADSLVNGIGVKKDYAASLKVLKRLTTANPDHLMTPLAFDLEAKIYADKNGGHYSEVEAKKHKDLADEKRKINLSKFNEKAAAISDAIRRANMNYNSSAEKEADFDNKVALVMGVLTVATLAARSYQYSQSSPTPTYGINYSNQVSYPIGNSSLWRNAYGQIFPASSVPFKF